jgi:hypothetical protein
LPGNRWLPQLPTVKTPRFESFHYSDKIYLRLAALSSTGLARAN